MNLIIVESPTKARTLSKFLGSDYSVVATMGHIMDLPKSKIGIDVEKDFEPDYQVVEKRKKAINEIKSLSKKANDIYVASDPDREGEAIAHHIYEIIETDKDKGKKKTNKIKRIVFHEITKSAVEEAIKKPRDVDTHLVNAQIARRVLDRLVGYKLSPLLWKKVRRGLSAGRVQTVAVRLIVEREREIQAFKPEEYWDIWVEVSKVSEVPQVSQAEHKNTTDTFIVELVKVNDKKADIRDKGQAEKIVFDLEKAAYKVSDVSKKEVRKSPYPPFTTSTMTQAGARVFGWSAKKTMSVAQSLYEEGLITYHRTDSTFIAAEAIEKVRKYIPKNYGNKYLPEKPKFYKTKSKVAQEAHEAIRPTDVNIINSEKTDIRWQREAEKLYKLIWKRFVSCQMTQAVYDETRISVEAIGNSELGNRKNGETSNQPQVSIACGTRGTLNSRDTFLLRASGQIMKFDGWKILFQVENGKLKIENESEQKLPDVTKDESLDLIKVNSQQKFTLAPARYNEASLIKTLEKLGIGRPSTYAPVINTIQLRAYVEKDEGKFTPTSIGYAVNDFLVGNFVDVFDYQFTAQMEKNLDLIANGEIDWRKMMKDFYDPFSNKILTAETEAKRVKIEAEKLGKKCPECKTGELVVRTGRFGKFISCSTFPDCRYTSKYEVRIDVKCPECKDGEVIIKRSKKGRKFYGCNKYPKCKWASWSKPAVSGEK